MCSRASLCLALVSLLPCAGLAQAQPAAAPAHPAAVIAWQQAFNEALPMLGERNWIAIVDAAYPWEGRSGVNTIATRDDHLAVIGEVLKALKTAPYLKATVYIDAEMAFVPEARAPGMNDYRAKLKPLLADQMVTVKPDREIGKMLDKAAKSYRVLVLKSTLALPYSAIFIQLDRAYWSDEAEAQLREAMKQAGGVQ